MILLINNPDLKICDMDCTEETNPEYMAMAELHKEIGTLVQKSVDEGHKELTSSDIEHILKMTSDVTLKIKVQKKELTV